MRIKILKSVGRDILDLVPPGEFGHKVALGLVGANLVEGEVRDMDPREAELLKKHGLAEDAPDETNDTSPAALAKKLREANS